MKTLVKLTPVLVDDLHWELLRLMRNLCRKGMTGTQEEISEIRQAAYAKSTQNQHFLYYAYGTIVGFSRISPDNTFSYGVSPFSRGLGYGHDIIAHLQQITLSLSGDVFQWNKASRIILQQAGFDIGDPVNGICPITWSKQA